MPLILLIILIIFPLVYQNAYYQHLMILVFIWVAIGSGWNVNRRIYGPGLLW